MRCTWKGCALPAGHTHPHSTIGPFNEDDDLCGWMCVPERCALPKGHLGIHSTLPHHDSAAAVAAFECRSCNGPYATQDGHSHACPEGMIERLSEAMRVAAEARKTLEQEIKRKQEVIDDLRVQMQSDGDDDDPRLIEAERSRDMYASRLARALYHLRIVCDLPMRAPHAISDALNFIAAEEQE